MTTITNIHAVAQSGNSKTGKIPVTYRGMQSCPASCPFLPTGEIGGCYGTGRIFASAERHARTMTQEQLTEVFAKAHRAARVARDRIVGDVVKPDGTIDYDYIASVARAALANALRPFGYSHAWEDIDPDLIEDGYVMNASTETPEDAERAVLLGFPVVITNDDIPEGTMIAGKRVVTCPAQTRDDVDCNSCRMCARGPERAYITRFLTHGTAVKKARRAIARKMGQNDA